MPVKPTTAMVLAAGLGLRMRPLTEHRPKPLVEVAGKPLLDHVLDRLKEVDVGTAVVNVHYLPDQIIHHVATRQAPHVVISDERDMVLGTGGGGSPSSVLGNSSPGGNGGGYGAGGGGSGAAVDSVGNSGAGGNGADGYVRVIAR